MFAAQLAKTTIELNAVGYFIDADPSPMMFVRDTQDRARQFSKDRLDDMLRLCPALGAKLPPSKNRDPNNTAMFKKFPGGFLVLVGSNKPGDLASWPVRVLILDELDRFEAAAGREGDPFTKALMRISNFWNGKVIAASTPTVMGESRIESLYLDSSREVWEIPCPDCRTFQEYEWGRVKFERVEGRNEVLEAPRMVCVECGVLNAERKWKENVGRWRPTLPGLERADGYPKRGFRLSGLASPWVSWEKLAGEWLEAQEKGPEVLKVFINDRLAELWEDKGEKLDEGALAKRRHFYGCDVPAGVVWLTAGVDVHPDRLEMEVVGWGPGRECWGIEYRVFFGDTQGPEVWAELDAALLGSYVRMDGAVLPISCTAVDSQFATSRVHRFCRPRFSRYVFAVRGEGGPGKPVVGPWRRGGKNKNVAVFPVGTDAGKDMVFSALMLDFQGPGFCHFPMEERLGVGTSPQPSPKGEGEKGRYRGYGEEYFAGLMSEKRVMHKVGGRVYHTWVKRSAHARNEPLDCRVYATAALEIRNPDLEAMSGARELKPPMNADKRGYGGKGSGGRVIHRGEGWEE